MSRLSRLWTRPARAALDAAGAKVAETIQRTQRHGARLALAGLAAGLVIGAAIGVLCVSLHRLRT